VLTVVIAFTGPDMGTSGWRVRMSANLQHWAAVSTRWLSWLPGWVFAVVLLAAAIYLLRHARARRTPDAPSGAGESCCTDTPAAVSSSLSSDRMVRDE